MDKERLPYSSTPPPFCAKLGSRQKKVLEGCCQYPDTRQAIADTTVVADTTVITMGDLGPVWKGLFQWSMQHQDGTAAAQPMSETDRQWLEDALRSAMVDLGKRMVDIKEALDVGGASLGEKERLLDELVELVESIDQARDLHTIGGLPTLLDILGCPHPSLRWRAAEVVATCVQNNPAVQELFLGAGVLPRVEALLRDADPTCRVKGALAVSCLVRGHAPSLLAFRQDGGVATLTELLRGAEPRLQRKSAQILQYMLRAAPQDRAAAVAGGLLPGLAAALGSEDGDLRGAALGLAQELAADTECLRAMQQDSALRGEVEALGVRLDTLPREEWEAAKEEAEGLRGLAGALVADLPPPAPPVAVADPVSTGAPPAALQLIALPENQP